MGDARSLHAMSTTRDMNDDAKKMVMNSSLYREFLAEREEILRHKWLESEKAGYDIGFERALLDWIVKHRSNWRKSRRSGSSSSSSSQP
jgi:hypothetical protein